MGPETWCLEEESALVERATSDPDAFGEIYERYIERIYAFASARLNSRAEAEYATGEVFLKALRGIGRYRCSDKPFRVWLYRIAANVVVDRCRRRRQTTTLEDAPSSAIECADTADDILEGVQKPSVRAAVDGLPRQQRLAITLRFSADLANTAIAHVMGKSRAAVNLLLYRGVQTLRSQLGTTILGQRAQGGLNARYV